jgi:tetratricopeptide (TPR) repeat protein
MPPLVTKTLKMFYCYARKDQELREELEHHLADLKRFYHIESWFDHQISPGENWEKTIEEQLNQADLILLLISPDFLASDYCYNNEMQRALIRHNKGEAKIIPIILRPVHWISNPFSTIQTLPKDARPVTKWTHIDDAFCNIAIEIEKIIKDLLFTRKTKEEWNKEGNTLYKLKRYEEALTAYEQAIRLDPNLAYVYNNKGKTLNELKRYEEALTAYKQAIRLDPNLAYVYNNKGKTLNELKRYEEALAAYEQAIRLNPNHAKTYNNKGDVLNALKHFEEAKKAYQKAQRLKYT